MKLGDFYPHCPERRDRVAGRFWSKANKRRECWEWMGSTQNKGCGQFALSTGPYGHVTALAPRVSYMLAYREVPDDLFVCHTCDNPLCVRPDHLFLGTQKDNMVDCSTKSRWRNGNTRGEEIGGHKLTERDVYEMRHKYARGEATTYELADEYGVRRATVCYALKGKTWTHVAGPTFNNMVVQGERHPIAKLTEVDVREIRRRCSNGERQHVIARDYGINQQTVSKIALGLRWGWVEDLAAAA